MEQEWLFISIQTRSSLQLTLTKKERATHLNKSSWRQLTYNILFCTAKDQFRKLETNVPRKGIARPQSQFPLSCVCERFMYIFLQSICLFCRRKFVDRSKKYICKSLRPRNYQKRNTCMEFSLQCVVSACMRTRALKI